MRSISNYKLLAMYASSHYLTHCPAMVLEALILLILPYFGITLLQYGLIITARSLISGFCSPLGGALADRLGKRIWPPLSMVITGSATLTIGLFGKTSLYLFACCLLAISFSGTLFHPSVMSTISDRFQRERSKAFSIFALGGQAGFGTGPLTVAVLLWLGGGGMEDPFTAYRLWSIPILCMSVIMVITHLKDPTIGISPERDAEPTRKVGGSSRRALPRTTILIPTFLLLLLIMSLRGFGRNLFEKFFVPFLAETKQMSEATAAFYLSLLTLIGLPGTMLGGLWADKYGEKRILMIAYTMATLGLTLLLLVQHPILIPLALLILAFGQNAAMPSINSLTAKIIPLRARGKAYGLTFFFPVALGSVAPTVAAAIIESSGYEIVFLSTIGLYALATLLTLFVSETSRPRPVSGRSK